MDNVAEYILELHRGEGFPFKGNYSGFLEKKMARLELEAKIDNKRKTSLKRELEASVRRQSRARCGSNCADEAYQRGSVRCLDIVRGYLFGLRGERMNVEACSTGRHIHTSLASSF